MSYHTEDYKTTVEDAHGYEFDVDCEISYWMAKRPFSEDDGDEIDILSIKCCHDVLAEDGWQFVHRKGEDVECGEDMKDKIRERFTQHIMDVRESAMAERYDDER